jgi:hypothetical protein
MAAVAELVVLEQGQDFQLQVEALTQLQLAQVAQAQLQQQQEVRQELIRYLVL